jgi:hypothetical protein
MHIAAPFLCGYRQAPVHAFALFLRHAHAKIRRLGPGCFFGHARLCDRRIQA